MSVMVEIINLTIMLTVLVAAILAVKRILGRRITPRGHMLMWILVAVLLISWPLAKWMPETDWAVRNYMPRVAMPRVVASDEMAADALNEIVVEIPAAFQMHSEGVSVKPSTHIPCIFILWAAGSVAGIAVIAVGYMRQQKVNLNTFLPMRLFITSTATSI